MCVCFGSDTDGRRTAKSGSSAPRSPRRKAVLSTSTSYTTAGTTIGPGPGRRGGPRTHNSHPEGGIHVIVDMNELRGGGRGSRKCGCKQIIKKARFDPIHLHLPPWLRRYTAPYLIELTARRGIRPPSGVSRLPPRGVETCGIGSRWSSLWQAPRPVL